MKNYAMLVALLAVALMGLLHGTALADFTLPDASDITDGVAPVLTYAGAIVGGLIVFFGVRKAIKLTNRS